MKKKSAQERFWEKVAESDNGCWIWLGSRVRNCRGKFWDGTKIVQSHIYAWKEAYGEIPNGIFVLHSCDTDLCVNPDHLFLGTYDDIYGTDQERFWSRVKKSDGCWEWLGTTDPYGYGQFSTKTCRLAHRFSWEIHNGPIPDGLFVLHTCDNPPCSNPNHLFLGTHQDNAQDRAKKNRSYHPYGEKNRQAKLTNEKVTAIINRHKLGESRTSLMEAFNISRSVIAKIVTKQGWQHIE